MPGKRLPALFPPRHHQRKGTCATIKLSNLTFLVPPLRLVLSLLCSAWSVDVSPAAEQIKAFDLLDIAFGAKQPSSQTHGRKGRVASLVDRVCLLLANAVGLFENEASQYPF